MNHKHPTSIQSLQQLLRQGELSAVELCQLYLHNLQQHQSAHNAFITIDAEAALAQAKEADKLIANQQATCLTGIPIAHKDIFCTKDTLTTCGSKMLANFTPPYDATVVTLLKQAGMVSLGKTNMDEFAMGSSNQTSYFGAVKNPWSLSQVPGGSSGGSAAAVSAGLCVAATGSDTGGSIRQPAAFCGLTGIKPTYGTISRYGMVAFASSLDQAGVFAHSAEDAALVLEALLVQDDKDATSITHPQPKLSVSLDQPATAGTIGLPKAYFDGETLAPAQARLLLALKQFYESQGFRCVDIDLPHLKQAIACYYVIAPAEASANLARYDGVRFGFRAQGAESIDQLFSQTRSLGFGDEVKRRILIGTYTLSAGYYDAYFAQAQKVRRLIQQDFLRAFQQVDYLLAPVTPTTAFAADSVNALTPVEMYQGDLYTLAVNLAGLPALSMPCGFIDDLPLGAQLIAAPFDEGRLLQMAHLYQQHSDHHLQRPATWQGVTL